MSAGDLVRVCEGVKQSRMDEKSITHEVLPRYLDLCQAVEHVLEDGC